MLVAFFQVSACSITTPAYKIIKNHIIHNPNLKTRSSYYIIINNNHFFGNEKHLKCEKIIISLEKKLIQTHPFFRCFFTVFSQKMHQSRINMT